MDINQFKRELEHRDVDVTHLFRMANFIFVMVFQMVVIFTSYVMMVFILASSDMDVYTRRAAGTAVFVFTISLTAVLGYWWLKVVFKLGENKRKKRRSNGQYKSPSAAAKVDHDKRTEKTWLIDGKLYTKSQLDSLAAGYDGGVGGYDD